MTLEIARKIAVSLYVKGHLSFDFFTDLLMKLGQIGEDPESLSTFFLRVLELNESALQDLSEEAEHCDPSNIIEPPKLSLLRATYGKEELAEIGEADPNETLEHPRYVIGRELGRGGVGRVVAAWDRYLQRSVAVKVALPNTKKAAESISLEARTTGGLEHPNIIPVYDFARTGTNDLFYAMKYVRRHSLYEVILGLREEKPEIVTEYSLIRLLNIFQQICMALHYAHEKGVVHRDIKPDNIMLGEYGEVLVVDWGLAYVYTKKASHLVKRRTIRSDKKPRLVGTPEYMPPEQAQGDTSLWGPGLDIFALGATLYEILTLHPPRYGQTTQEVLEHVLYGEIINSVERNPDRRVPAGLNQICMKALAYDREDRYETARDLRDAVEQFLESRRKSEEQFQQAHQLTVQASIDLKKMNLLDFQLEKKSDFLAQQLSTIDPDASMLERQRLWKLEDEVQELTLNYMDLFEQVEAALQQAIVNCSEGCKAQTLLANLYLIQSEKTLSSRMDLLPRYYRRLVLRVDPKGVGTQLTARGRLLVRGLFEQGDLFSLQEKDRQLVPSEESISFSSGFILSLTPGRYLIRISVPTERFIYTTCKILSGETNVIRLGELSAPPNNTFVYIPGGTTHCGGDPFANHSLQARAEYVGPFFASRYHVTFGEYSLFLSELYLQDPDRAFRHIPRTSGGGMLCDLKPKVGYEPGIRILASANKKHYPSNSGAEWMVPVFGVSLYDVQAYISWRAARDNISYRLPSEREWERLIRGGDGRHYSWGDSFDSSFCLTQATHRSGTWPEPAGVYAQDMSPFGIHDLSGGVQTWTQTHSVRGWVVKGGAWNLGPIFSRAASRRVLSPETRLPEIGFRLVIDISN